MRLSGEFPTRKLILAHAAISDLAWLWRVMPEHPNLFVDTAWWNPADLIALFTLAPPTQILWASDSPVRAAGDVGDRRAALRAAGRPAAGGAAARGRRPARARARRRAGERRRAAGRRAGARPAARARGHAPRLRDGPRCSPARTPTSRSRSRAWPAPSATTSRTRTCSPRCWSCSTTTPSTATCEPTPGRPYPPAGRFLVTALAVARTPEVPLPEPGVPATRAEAERASGA